MFAGQSVVVLGQRIVVLVVDEALGQIEIAFVAAAFIGEKKVFRQRIGFIPGKGDALVRAGFLLGATQSFFRKVRKHGVGGALEHIERDRVGGKLMGVDQAATRLIKRVAG